MTSNLKANDELKSKKTINQQKYISDSIKEDKLAMSREELDKCLKHDNPSGKCSLDGMKGIIDLGYKVDPVKLKKDSYKK